MTPIPDHIVRHDWYAPHQAWLLAAHGTCRHDPTGAPKRADLTGADLTGADLTGVDIRFADLKDADLRFADLRDANLWGADLRFANLWGANLWDANLWGADLRFANLRFANLWGANLWDANLWGADLRFANLRFANLWGANLWDAYLGGANLRDADLGDADLGDADLTRADLGGANLGGTNLKGAKGIATEEEEAATWAAVCAAVLAEPDRLEMGDWHGPGWDPEKAGDCGTTHCLAGWAQALSDDPEVRRMAPELAGSRLLPRHAHLFYRSNDGVRAIIESRA